MKSIGKAIIGIVIGVALTGCAASGPKYKEMEKSVPSLQANQGRVFFLREDTFVGGGLRPDIKFDDAVVGVSKPGGFFYIDAAPGPHKVSTATEMENKLTFVLDAGETKYVKTSVSMGILVGHVVPELISVNDAEKVLPDLSYIGTQGESGHAK
ncbi:MAG: DUF2846 domain-containing protein [Burkholderiaceae bacterium]|nr:DUF2846 domain-containing protein [Burkholderiaceae bacterium]